MWAKYGKNSFGRYWLDLIIFNHVTPTILSKDIKFVNLQHDFVYILICKKNEREVLNRAAQIQVLKECNIFTIE